MDTRKNYILVRSYAGEIELISQHITKHEAQTAMLIDFKNMTNCTDNEIIDIKQRCNDPNYCEYDYDNEITDNKAWAEAVGPENTLCLWKIIDLKEKSE